MIQVTDVDLQKNGAVFHDMLLGIEREALRLNSDGQLAITPHPKELKKPYFTKDFSESQIEIVTDPKSSVEELTAQLEELHVKAYRNIGNEILWPVSTPPSLPPENKIPIADLGNDDEGRQGNNYRKGLVNRYGKYRQMISGVHINISAGEMLLDIIISRLSEKRHLERRGLIDYIYTAAATGIYEYIWIMLLLCGATVSGGPSLEKKDNYSKIVSYRNSINGYGGTEYRKFLNLENLKSYIAGIEKALNTESKEFREKGLIRNGELLQLNAKVIQSDKEFYAPVRIKQSAANGESQLQALRLKGAGYLELRFFDIDPYYATGVNPDTLKLIKLFFLDSLLRIDESTPQKRSNEALLKSLSMADTIASLSIESLVSGNKEKTAVILNKAEEKLLSMHSVAALFDGENNGHEYTALLKKYINQIRNPETLLSSLIMRDLNNSRLSWDKFGCAIASAYSNRYRNEYLITSESKAV
jgi:glutamate--cysteine ligase